MTCFPSSRGLNTVSKDIWQMRRSKLLRCLSLFFSHLTPLPPPTPPWAVSGSLALICGDVRWRWSILFFYIFSQVEPLTWWKAWSQPADAERLQHRRTLFSEKSLLQNSMTDALPDAAERSQVYCRLSDQLRSVFRKEDQQVLNEAQCLFISVYELDCFSAKWRLVRRLAGNCCHESAQGSLRGRRTLWGKMVRDQFSCCSCFLKPSSRQIIF